jgi:hypothetical protein
MLCKYYSVSESRHTMTPCERFPDRNRTGHAVFPGAVFPYCPITVCLSIYFFWIFLDTFSIFDLLSNVFY